MQQKRKKPKCDKKRDFIVQSEKEALKNEVDKITARPRCRNHYLGRSRKLKKEAATKQALNIENKVAILENKEALKERNGEVDANKKAFKITFGDDEYVFDEENDSSYKRKEDIRTYSGLTFAFGLNNAIADGNAH